MPITTKVVSSNSVYGEVYSIQHYVIKVCQWLETGRWFSPGTPVSSSNKTDRHARYNRNTINQTSNSLHQIELTQQKHRNIRFVLFLGTLNTECQEICSINHNYDWENTYVNNWWMIKYFVQGLKFNVIGLCTEMNFHLDPACTDIGQCAEMNCSVYPACAALL